MQIFDEKQEIQVGSRVGSLENLNYKPKGRLQNNIMFIGNFLNLNDNYCWKSKSCFDEKRQNLQK